ncbi:MAG: hypothetical protein LBS70_10840 [Candidatus Accumulibacter sp.]|jgi:hypothetical protein|nr:hypothetical protein [Accumulibacter sp.]
MTPLLAAVALALAFAGGAARAAGIDLSEITKDLVHAEDERRAKEAAREKKEKEEADARAAEQARLRRRLREDDELCLFLCDDRERRAKSARAVFAGRASNPTARFAALVLVADEMNSKGGESMLPLLNEARALASSPDLWRRFDETRPERDGFRSAIGQDGGGRLTNIETWFFQELMHGWDRIGRAERKLGSNGQIPGWSFDCAGEKFILKQLYKRAYDFSDERMGDYSGKLDEWCRSVDAALAAQRPAGVGPVKNFHMNHASFPIMRLDGIVCPNIHLENSRFDTIEIRHAKIGSLKIKNVVFERLDLTGTQAESYDIDPSGEIVSAGSNYPKGGK